MYERLRWLEKNDRIDAKKIADCLRCDFLPECYMPRRRFANDGAPALSEPVGPPSGTDEEQNCCAADGSRL